MNGVALQTNVFDIVEEYNEKILNVEQSIKDFQDSVNSLNMASTIRGTYVSNVIPTPYIHASNIKKNLLMSGWKAVYNYLNIDSVASANDKKFFERTLQDPPELTVENAKATFGDYLLRPRFHKLKGLAEVFVHLDPAYKSHSKVKIGVKGLPKRVIITNVRSFGSYGRDKIRDIINALASYRNEPQMYHEEFRKLDNVQWSSKTGEVILDGSHVSSDFKERVPNRGVKIKKFNNGNAHVIFDEDALLDINRALAEFYGDVLPDVEEENVKHQPSTNVSSDLQFYYSPEKVVDAAIDFAGLYKGMNGSKRVLEPSCGDGRILDKLKWTGCSTFGIEYHAGRAQECRDKGHSVLTGNFLEQPPKEEFDYVIMNPPFNSRGYMKHINHALKFLKSGGILVSILPATAKYDHNIEGEWRDLPIASFAECGTNVPTGMVKIKKP